MNMIVAVDRNWAIGCDNRLLVSIPADMKFFRETTMGKVVIMGRKTLESFPGGRPLPGRTNIVLTRREDVQIPNAIICSSVDEVLEKVKDYAPQDVFVIGGSSVYEQMLPYCDLAHVTKIDYAYAADAFFPDLDADPDWEITADSDEQTYFDLEYRFLRYERIGHKA